MSFYETQITYDCLLDTSPLSDFGIVSIKSSGSRNMICKVIQNNKIKYFSHYPKSVMELYLFLEIMNGSPLWEMKYEFSPHAYNRISIKIIINLEKDLIHEYLNTSIAINSIISDNFDKLPVFDKTDFSSKSFLSYEDPVEPPSSFKIKLYEYQKRSLGKMIKMEKGDTSFQVKYTAPIHFNELEYIYDPISNQRVTEDKYLNIKIRGGVLSDEMGLGKTITSVALIATNPAPNNHPATKLSTNYQMNKLFTKATLVLCPSHLTKQWESEVKKCNPNFTVLTIVSKNDMGKLKVTDIQNADIIIVAHQFLMNFKYYPTLHYKQCTASTYSSYDRHIQLKTKLTNLLKDEAALLALETPVFEFFFFHRIILDEGHEIFGEMLGSGTVSRYMSEWVTSMDSNYYWYVSGTPFINFLGVKNCSAYLNLKLVEPERELYFDYSRKNTDPYGRDINSEIFTFLNKEYVWNNILNKICIRNRKKDVENQIQIPGFEEKLIWLKFTDLEKQLYEAKKGKVPNQYLQQLCCHPMVIESSKKIFGDVEVDLALMQDKLIDYHKKRLEEYKLKISLLDPKKQEYHMLKKTYESNMNESSYIYNILNGMKNKEIDEDTTCSICTDVLDNPTLTACGHLFCYDCLKMCLADKKKCPICKTDLTGKEILVTTKKSEKSNVVNPLIAKYGSKLGKTISIIRTIVAQPSSRIIIFSQWDDMLNLIGKTLSENGVENCFVKGNVWSRNSAINKFKAGKNSEGQENKVIMLSLKNAASGTNLTEATHILFIEPINASSEECKAIEGQAIGRACRVGQKNKIMVMRILIENTIEEEIYKNNYNKNVVVDIKNDELQFEDLKCKTMVL
jgi:DNA repair protein RAD5